MVFFPHILSNWLAKHTAYTGLFRNVTMYHRVFPYFFFAIACVSQAMAPIRRPPLCPIALNKFKQEGEKNAAPTKKNRKKWDHFRFEHTFKDAHFTRDNFLYFYLLRQRIQRSCQRLKNSPVSMWLEHFCCSCCSPKNIMKINEIKNKFLQLLENSSTWLTNFRTYASNCRI